MGEHAVKRTLRTVTAPFVVALLTQVALGAPPGTAQRVAAALAAGEAVRASWFQPGADDATAALQGAIDSGAKTVIVEDLGRPWNVEKIRAASKQEIVFEKGVVVQAKRGSFRGRNDSLMTISGVQNVRLTGYGATLRMWREDYDRPPYEHATWRHVLNLRGACNVCIAGLTLALSGGDGIYISGGADRQPSRNVEIRDVVCDRNYRQGISVISAENLLLENVVMRNTAGTPPEAGIDFEPNHPWEKLVNCVMRNCLSEGNGTAGYTLYLKSLNRESTPVSIRLENCRSRGNRPGFRFICGNGAERTAVRGTMDVVGCTFDSDRDGGIVVGEKPADAVRLRFLDCRIVNAATDRKAAAPISLSAGPGNTENVGGIEFDCLVEDPVDRPPMKYLDLAGGLRLVDVTGRLVVARGGRRTTYTLDRKQLDAWMPEAAYADIPRLATSPAELVPALDGPAGSDRYCTARQRGRAEFLLWAQRGRPAEFIIRVNRVGRGSPRPAPVRLVAPSGKEQKLAAARAGEETPYRFDPQETGAYRVLCAAENGTVQARSATHRMCLYRAAGPFHFLGGGGEVHFWVPAGVTRAAVKVGGGAENERAKAALFDPAGNKVAEQDNIAQARQFLIERPPQAPGEAWRLRITRPGEGVLDDHYVELQGLPPLLAAQPGDLLKPMEDKSKAGPPRTSESTQGVGSRCD